MRAGLVRAPHDRLRVDELRRLEQDVAERDEQRPLVDRVEHRVRVRHDHDLDAVPLLRLEQVAHRRELALRVDDPVALRRRGREHESTIAAAIVTFWCIPTEPGGAPTIRPIWSPTSSGIVHQPSPQARIPRSRHVRAYSATRSSAAAGIAPSEWLIR